MIDTDDSAWRFRPLRIGGNETYLTWWSHSLARLVKLDVPISEASEASPILNLGSWSDPVGTVEGPVTKYVNIRMNTHPAAAAVLLAWTA